MLKDNEGMTIAISALDKRLLEKGVAGWRGANANIDTAISSANWGAIERAQHDRFLHANMIALIIHKYSNNTPEHGAHP